MYVELDPEIAKVFHASKAVSTSNGRSYHMMKATAKPRRTKEEIRIAKELEEAQKLEVELKLKRYDEMQKQLAQQETLLQNQEGMQNTMSHLFEKGLIKQDSSGIWTAVENLEEQELVLQHRQAEALRTQQLEQHVNKNAPPTIGSDRQKTSQQLEFIEHPMQSNIKPPSGIPGAQNRIQSRKAAA